MCPILSAMYSSSLNVYHTVSHVKITMPQHELSYNPNRFAIRDPRGGNWGEWGQNMEKVKIMLKKSNFFNLCFESCLSPDILGVISVWRNTLLVMMAVWLVWPTHKTTN